MSMRRQIPLSKVARTPAVRRAIRRFLVGRQGTAGSALIELALVVSMVFVLFVTVLDFGMGFYY